MDRLSYAGDSFLTGTLIARALLDYAQALAETGSAATVAIPTIGADGNRSTTTVLIGPSSQLASTAVATDIGEMEDAELVERLEALASGIRHEAMPTARPNVDEGPPAGDFSDFGL